MLTNNHTVGSSKQMDVRKLVTMGMLSALGVVLSAFIEFPIMPAAPFLKYDPADIPILMGTLVYGPMAGLMMTVVVSTIQTLLHGSGGWIGLVMHIVATGAMALVVGGIYGRSKKTLSSAAISLALGALTMVVVMTGMNLIMTPIFMGVEMETVVEMLVPVIIPFNLLKAGLNSLATFVLYKLIEKIVVHS